MYVAFRRYGYVNKINWADPAQQELVACADTTEATFVLSPTDATDALKLLHELDCGSASVPVKWTHNKRRMRTESADGRLVPAGPADEGTGERPPPPENPFDLLNDDCVREIFESAALAAEDLCAIGQACERFNWIAKSAFRTRYRTQPINLAGPHWSLGSCEVLFTEFGQYITSIYLIEDGSVRSDIMLGFVGKYCPHLVHLACSRLKAMAQAIDGYERLAAGRRPAVAAPPFGRLQRLEYVSRVNSINTLPAVRLPSLRRLNMSNVSLNDPESTRSFFAMNGTLSELCLHRTFIFHHIKDILEHTTTLRRLELDQVTWGYDTITLDADLVCFGRLSRLRAFECTPLFLSLTPSILAVMRDARVPLKELRLRSPKYLPIVEQMPTIEDLRIYGLRPEGVRSLEAFVASNRHLELVSNGRDDWRGMNGFQLVDELERGDD